MIAAVRELNQVEVVGETFRYTLNSLATVVPDWLKGRLRAEWVERYGERMDEYRLPKDKGERADLVNLIGQDGLYLLECIEQEVHLSWLKEVPAVQILKQVWEQQYKVEVETESVGVFSLRAGRQNILPYPQLHFDGSQEWAACVGGFAVWRSVATRSILLPY